MASLSKVLGALEKGVGIVLKDTFRRNHQVVREESDLPGDVGETHVLEEDIEYEFNDVVTLQGNIEITSSNQLSGSNWGRDIINYLGTDALFTGTDAEFFMKNLSCMAPNGSIFDLSADATTEFLTQDCAVLQAQDLGTISGYKIPSFKSFSFDSFDEGLTFQGSPDKVYILSSPFRNAGAGVSAIKLDGDGGLDLNLFHVEGSFFKDFDATANALEVTGDPLNDFAIVTSNLSDFDLESRLVGVTKEDPKWQFSGNSDVPDSSVSGVLDQTGTNTVTISTGTGDSGNPVRMQPVVTADSLERFQEANSSLEYTGAKDRKVNASLNVTMQSTGGAEVDVSVYLGKNGSFEENGNQTVTLGSGGQSRSARAEAFFDVTAGDTIEAYIENTTNTDDIEVNDLDLIVRRS